jgi:D-glycero-D-manno-heptose 1,7-bisphosphate phosphatase
MGGRSCAFLDRDGVINVSPAPGEYVRTWTDFEFNPHAVDWIRFFNALEMLVIVVTNQRGVSLGLVELPDLEAIHRNMCEDLLKFGAMVDDVFCCPHAEGSCECRKPRPGMVLQAARKWNINISESVMIGDSTSDRKLAENCGMRFIQVANGRIVPHPRQGSNQPALQYTGAKR